MSQTNPITGSIVQATQAQRVQSTDREHQVRRQQVRSRDAAARGDQFEHTVESSDSIAAIHEQDHGNDPNGKRRHPDTQEDQQSEGDAPESLDITA